LSRRRRDVRPLAKLSARRARVIVRAVLVIAEPQREAGVQAGAA
jgi:hypothetical protein